MQLQLDIRESRGNGQHRVQEEYEALAQGHGGTKRDSQTYERTHSMGTKCKRELTRTPMCKKALSFT